MFRGLLPGIGGQACQAPAAFSDGPTRISEEGQSDARLDADVPVSPGDRARLEPDQGPRDKRSNFSSTACIQVSVKCLSGHRETERVHVSESESG